MFKLRKNLEIFSHLGFYYYFFLFTVIIKKTKKITNEVNKTLTMSLKIKFLLKFHSQFEKLIQRKNYVGGGMIIMLEAQLPHSNAYETMIHHWVRVDGALVE